MSIPKISEKIKSLIDKPHGKDILSFIVILAISLGSFYLGQYNATNADTSQIQISGVKGVISQNSDQSEYQGQYQATYDEPDIYTKGNYTASSRGKKYYPIDCPAAKNLKEGNKIYFKTASEAEAKGYTLSTSCN